MSVSNIDEVDFNPKNIKNLSQSEISVILNSLNQPDSYFEKEYHKCAEKDSAVRLLRNPSVVTRIRIDGM